MNITNKNVLVVEDNEELMNVLVSSLEMLGYQCQQALDGAQALEKLREQQFDYVVCDYWMPHMNGMELFQKASAEISTCPPFLFSTGGQSLTLIPPYPNGILGIINKPYSVFELHEKLSESKAH